MNPENMSTHEHEHEHEQEHEREREHEQLQIPQQEHEHEHHEENKYENIRVNDNIHVNVNPDALDTPLEEFSITHIDEHSRKRTASVRQEAKEEQAANESADAHADAHLDLHVDVPVDAHAQHDAYMHQEQQRYLHHQQEQGHAHEEGEDDEDLQRKRVKLSEETNSSINNMNDGIVSINVNQHVKRKSIPPPKKLNNEQWDAMFERLVEYKTEHGDCLVPKRYTADPKLGTWVETQRVQYKKLQAATAEQGDSSVVTPNKRLNAERLQRLQGIGFAWSAKNLRKPKPTSLLPGQTPKRSKSLVGSAVDAAQKAASRQRLNDAQWTEMYDRLFKYKESHHDCLVPKKFEEDPKLATWVETQRVLYNRDYRKQGTKGGDLQNDNNPPQEHLMEGGEPSGAEVATGSKTPEEWAAELDTSGAPSQEATAEDAAEVAATMEAAAMEIVEEVVTTVATDVDMQEDHGELPTADSKDHGELVDVSMDDTATKGGTVCVITHKRLTQERKDKLEVLGFVWSLRSKRVDDHWDEMFNQLIEYKENYHDCLVPSRYEENFKLGKWVETQRYEYTKLQRAAAGQSEVEEKTGEIGDASSKSRPTNPRLTEERLRRLESIGFEWKVKHKMKRYYDRQWDTMIEKLLKYKELHGHCLVPKRFPPDMKLGTWVHTQRIQYRKFLAGTSIKKEGEPEDPQVLMEEQTNEDIKGGDVDEMSFRLTEDRRKRLEDAGFVWSAREVEKTNEPHRITRNSYDDQWDSMFERLDQFKAKHGDCLVPKRCKEDPKLGTWVDTQRVQYKKMVKHLAKTGIEWEGPSIVSGNGEESTSTKPVVGRLTDDRIRRLEGIGFIWSLRDDWQKHYDELIEYKKDLGHCNVPARYQKNRRLGIWVSAQRQQFKIMNMPEDLKPQRSAPLTLDRIELLNDLGFTWTIRSRDSLGESWNQRLDELRQYKTDIGNCLVPSRYPPNPELGVWVGTQRTQFRLYQRAKEMGTVSVSNSAMSDDRIGQLEELGFVWALRGGSDNVWRKRVGDLIEYRAKYGNCDVSQKYRENTRLGLWAGVQRVQYKLMREGKLGSLDEEKVAELDNFGFTWEEPDIESAVLGTEPASSANIMDEEAAALAITAADQIEVDHVQTQPVVMDPVGEGVVDGHAVKIEEHCMQTLAGI